MSADTAGSLAMIVFGVIIILILLRILIMVHRQAKKVNELERQLNMNAAARERKEE